jgi:hypothetical protein
MSMAFGTILRTCRSGLPWLVAVVMFFSVGTGGLARAGDSSRDSKQEAKTRFMSGQSHYNLNEYPAALNDFKEAYRLFPDPVFLYNLGQCERQLGHFDEAIRFYRSFLREQPKAPNRQDVLHKIEEMETALKNKPADADKGLAPPTAGESGEAKPGTVPAIPEPAASGTESPTPKLEYRATTPADEKPKAATTTDQPQVAPTLPTTPPVQSEPVERAPVGVDLVATSTPQTPLAESPAFYQRWWFWTAVGVVAVGAGVGIYIAASGNAASAPNSTLGSQKVF